MPPHRVLGLTGNADRGCSEIFPGGMHHGPFGIIFAWIVLKPAGPGVGSLLIARGKQENRA
jgi:hypothetical protein